MFDAYLGRIGNGEWWEVMEDGAEDVRCGRLGAFDT